jgi:ADP-heptose:LPS heptosyltransferase
LAFAYAATVAPTGPHEHAIERRLNYVRLLAADTANKRMDLFLPAEEKRRAEAILSKHFGTLPARLLALHPTGSDPYKWWPGDNFVELGNFLYEAYGASLLIISGAKDRTAAEAIAAHLSGPTLVAAANSPDHSAPRLLARLLVANDSRPLHMRLAWACPPSP